MKMEERPVDMSEQAVRWTGHEGDAVRGILYGLLFAGIFWTIVALCVFTPLVAAQLAH